MGEQLCCLAVLFSFSFTICAAHTCPVNFSYIETYPWRTSPCLNPYSGSCCQILHAVILMGLAQYLKDTSNFLLPDQDSSFACLLTLHTKLAALSLQPSLVTHCFHDHSQFAADPPRCAGIRTIQDWNKNMDAFTPQLESSCKGDLTNISRCTSCTTAGAMVTAELMLLSKNTTNAANCMLIVILYVAGIAGDSGPLDPSRVPCVLGIETVNSSASRRPSKLLVYGLPGGIVCLLFVLGVSMFYRKRSHKKAKQALHQEIVRKIKAKMTPSLGAKWFDEKELQQATNGFSQENFIGQGASGVVYRGMLSNGTLVAVKEVLNVDFLGDEEFFNEIEIVGKIRHKNLLSLRGYSVTSDDIQGRKRYLVYEFMSNGSIHNHLSGEHTREQLTWSLRRSIILDVAKGIAYLHYGVKPTIYHRDIKATNILLDFDMKAKVSDFSLATQSRGQSIVMTKVAGTHGYLAPEYALYGQLSEKSDVYSFGILILEVISGRKVLGSHNSPFLLISDWAWMQIKSGNVEEVFDETLREEEAKGIMERFVLVGILCAHVTAAYRPTIVEALNMLEGDIKIPQIPDRPLPVTDESFRSSCYDTETSESNRM